MSYRTEPPQVRLVNCYECSGTGRITETLDRVIVYEGECGRCDGEGRIEYDPYDNPYAPDTWKEAEGIA